MHIFNFWYYTNCMTSKIIHKIVKLQQTFQKHLPFKPNTLCQYLLYFMQVPHFEESRKINWLLLTSKHISPIIKSIIVHNQKILFCFTWVSLQMNTSNFCCHNYCIIRTNSYPKMSNIINSPHAHGCLAKPLFESITNTVFD